MKMWYCEVTLHNGARVSGVVNAHTQNDARRLVRQTVQGSTARVISITKLSH
jgi:hypothetical protein